MTKAAGWAADYNYIFRIRPPRDMFKQAVAKSALEEKPAEKQQAQHEYECVYDNFD